MPIILQVLKRTLFNNKINSMVKSIFLASFEHLRHQALMHAYNNFITTRSIAADTPFERVCALQFTGFYHSFIQIMHIHPHIAFISVTISQNLVYYVKSLTLIIESVFLYHDCPDDRPWSLPQKGKGSRIRKEEAERGRGV